MKIGLLEFEKEELLLALKKALKKAPKELRVAAKKYPPTELYSYGQVVCQITQYYMLGRQVYVSLYSDDPVVINGPAHFRDIPIEELRMEQ